VLVGATQWRFKSSPRHHPILLNSLVIVNNEESKFLCITQPDTHSVTHDVSNRREIVLTPSNHTYLTKRRRAYYYRRRIPSLLKHLFPQSEFIVSLKTTEFSDAKKLASRYDSYFDDLLSQEIIKKMRIPDPSSIRRLTVQADSQGNKKVEITPEDIQGLSQAGLSSEQIQTIILAAFRTDLGGNEISDEVQNPPSLSTIQPDRQKNPKTPGPLLSEAIDRYHEDLKTSKHNPDWEPSPKHSTFFRRLIEIIGDKPIDSVDRDDAKHVVRKIKELPSKSAKYKSHTVDEVINLNIDEKKLSAKTINDHLELYSRLFIWIAREINEQQSDPFDQLRVKADKKQKTNQTRSAFTREEIATIFSTPLYISGKYKSPYQFWVPLIALHTGARRAEIASLYIEDIQQDKSGVWMFDFNENSSDKKLKTVNSIRKTPIHPYLIELGLLDYVDTCKQQGKKRFFEDLENWTVKEGYGRPIGDWFNGEYLKELNIHVENKKIFHSFRHTFATELNKKGVSISIIEQLSGREIIEKKTVGEKVYIDDVENAELLQQLKKLDFGAELKNVTWIQKMEL
jgi:integrase